MPIPDDILRLIDQFHTQLTSYRSPEYNEAQARNEFIEPFFRALGWDVYNQQGYAYNYKDVIYEDSIRVAGATKAPDYAFRIGGTRKFFVEAKKPSVNLKDEISPAYQLRRYAWSAHLPLSILTDFEEFAVYDCRPKPDKLDKASTGRIMLLTYRDYPSHWDDIYDIFSRQAVLKGSFDQFAETATHKHGTAEVDDAFLGEIERWRELLVHNIALRNPSLSQRDLNYAVQMTIDRLIFLRICEDRRIEFYGQLQSLLNGGDTYARLCQLFRKADERYNSGLFHFHLERDQGDSPDVLTPALVLDDKPLKDILGNLYYPDSPYEFSVLPADILGQVYERFLGKVIRITSGHRAVVEDKPEVKKAGGVFYTPTFIVDYIVKNTLGKLLEGKVPGQVGVGRGTPLRVLDISCGSGSFLIGAYQYLLDWYLGGYILEPEKWSKGNSPRLYQIPSPDGAQWKLTTSERKRILLDHIYGVDIDSQAVEVTKLSLLLKVLEGESEESIGRQLSMFRERALPDLAHNIKCGNSLIEPDFYIAKQPTFLNSEEQYRINAFDWHREYADVFASSGGFEIIIGNPPYIHSREDRLSQNEKEYYFYHYKAAEYQINSFVLFIEKGFTLLKQNGIIGLIIPNYWLSTAYDSKLRHLVFHENSTRELVNLYQVFRDATVDTLLFFAQQGTESYPKHLTLRSVSREIKTIEQRLNAVFKGFWAFSKEIFIQDIDDDVKVSFYERFDLNGPDQLGQYFDLRFGMKPYQVGKGNPKQTKEIVETKIYDSDYKVDEGYLPLLKARNVRRYRIDWQDNWIKYGDHLAEPRSMELFTGPRILLQRIVSSDRLNGVFINEPYICNTDIITLKPRNISVEESDIKFCLGILVSKPVGSYLISHNVNLDRQAFPKINTRTLFTLPIPSISNLLTLNIILKENMVKLVDHMLALHQQLASCNTPNEKTILQRQIDITDRQIDTLVYELYGLTDEEIRLVESG